MREGEIEETKIPRNPLDVLAQQIVAIAADEEIAVDELHDARPRAYPFADLSRAQLENVLDMLAGRYPSDEFAELRPRIVWDRTGGTIRARDGARRLAVTNAGTIPDRGLFGVFLVDGGGRVGELDEEMVYEARAGQTFLLGASTWRIEEITRDRVLVSPAPGAAGRRAVLEGRGRRPAVRARPEDRRRLARALGAAATRRRSTRLRDEYLLDERAARNLLTFLREQADATGAVPSDRTIVVERFRDEIGDWRVCILSPFGGRVHAPWAMAIAARLRESLGVEAQSIWSDDGIALHFPDADVPPPVDELLLDPDEVEDLVVAGARRHGALRRALPRERRALAADPAPPAGRAHAALAAAAEGAVAAAGRAQVRLASRSCSRPTASACRTCSTCPRCAACCRGCRRASSTSSRSRPQSASPYSASLLFDYIATYMYEDDTPPAERRAQALSLDRDLLRELLGQEELRDLLDARRGRRGRAPAARRAEDARRAARQAAPARRPARRASTTRRSPRRCSTSGARCSSASRARSG